MLRLILFFILVAIPIAEVSLFIVIGGAIGALPTILIIVLTALIGTVLLRRQGAAALAALQRDLNAGQMPAAAIGQAVTVAVAGLLLLTPGFITDAAGFALFVPAVRRWLWRRVAPMIKVQEFSPGHAGYAGRDGQTINLDEDDYTAHPGAEAPRRGSVPPSAPNPNTPWNPHA